MNSLSVTTPIELYRERRFEDVVDRFWQINSPSGIGALELYQLARCLMKCGNFKQALVHLSDIRSELENDYRYWYRCALAEIGCANFSGALLALEKAAILTPESEIISFLISVCAYRTSHFDQSLEAMKLIEPFARKQGYLSEVEELRLSVLEASTIEELPVSQDWSEYGVFWKTSDQLEKDAIVEFQQILQGANPSVWGAFWSNSRILLYRSLKLDQEVIKRKFQNYLLSLDEQGSLSSSNNIYLLELLAKFCLVIEQPRLAIKIFDVLLEREAMSSGCYSLAGKCYLDNGYANKSITCFSEALRLDPNSQIASHNLIFAFEEAGQIENGYQRALGHLDAFPEDGVVVVWVGRYYFNKGELGKAEKRIMTADQLGLKHVTLDQLKKDFGDLTGKIMETPLELFRGRRYEDAVTQFRQLKKSNHIGAVELYQLARCLMKCGDFEQALVHLNSIRSELENDYRYWYRYALAKIGCANFSEAQVALERAATLTPKSEIISFLLSVCAYRSSNFKLSAETLKSISNFAHGYRYIRDARELRLSVLEASMLEELPSFDEWSEYGIFWKTSDLEEEEAIIDFQRILQSANPNIWGAFWVSSRILLFRDLKLDQEVIKRKFQNYFLNLDKQENLTSSSNDCFLELIAKFCLVIDEPRLACKIFDVVLDRKAVSSGCYCLAGKGYLDNGDANKAITCFTESLRLDPNNNNASYKLVLAFEEVGQIENALECAKYHLNVMPRDILVIIWLGRYYLELGYIDKAEVQIVKALRIERNNPTLTILTKSFQEKFGRAVKPNSTMPDYSHIDWNRVQIPEEFQYSGNSKLTNDVNNAGEVFRTLSNVVSALIVREMTTRFGQNGLGYLWVVIQQVLFVGIFAIVFEVRGRSLPYGIGPIAFLVTGVNAFFVFKNTKEQIHRALKRNNSLLYYRQISPLAIYLARGILEFFTGIFVFLVLIVISFLLGEELNMTSLLEVLFLFLVLGVFGASFGLVVSAIGMFFPAIDHFDAAINRILFFTSGLFFYANELPDKARDLLMYNPIFHMIELLRDGFFYSYTATYASFGYVGGWLVGLLFFGLVLERIARRRLLQI